MAVADESVVPEESGTPGARRAGHPIRLIVADDLARNRLTVFFRALLVLPHFLWIALWGIVALVAAIANWFATLFDGRSPDSLHNFLALYVKYVTQVYAYLHLAANPYPPFDGRAGYPVDVEVDPPREQPRLRVAARLVLALPAILVAATLAGAPTWSSYTRTAGGRASSSSYTLNSGGLLIAVAFLGWFAILARGKMPRGLRDAAAYALSYAAQLWSYLFLLTDRYPDSDPFRALAEVPERADPVWVSVEGELRRSRLTVFFRLPLAFPHFLWLLLWGIVALFAAIATWFATLVAGRSPEALHAFLSRYARYQVQVYAFVYLIANPFPGFAGAPGSYPVELSIAPRERQNRWKVAFRLVLAVPAFIVSSAYGGLMFAAAVLGWFASLATGKMPQGLRSAAGLALRYTAQLNGYLYLLTDRYPYSGPCTRAVAQAPPADAFASPALPEPS